MPEQRLDALLAYWERKRGARAFPARADIDPLELGFILGHLLLVDVQREPLRYRIRLHGTELAKRAGYDMTGKMLDTLRVPEFRELARRSFTKVVETRAPFRASRDRIIDRRRHRYDTLMLPLGGDAQVDMLLIGLIYEDAQHAVPVSRGSLVGAGTAS
jgi:hypothetical protein